MIAIQRPPEAAAEIFHRFASQAPIGATLIVGPTENVVVLLYGAVLGVLPPGTYTLHPQAVPMLARAASGPVLQAELWFVTASTVRGLRMGGALGSFHDSQTQVACTVRMMAQYALAVTDPARLVVSCASGGPTFETAEGVVSYVKGVMLSRAKELVGYAVDEGVSLSKLHDLQTRIASRLPESLGDLERFGMRVASVDDVTLMLPEDDQRELQRALVMAARTKAASSLACTRCGTAHAGGRFCTQCGGALAAR